MCTISWLPEPAGFHVVFNRDELRTRSDALPPEVHRGPRSRYVAAIDPASQGTWLAASETGVVFALLNRFVGDPYPPVPADRKSRGTLMTELAGSGPGNREVISELVQRDLSSYEPFIATATDAHGCWYVEWDGSRAWTDTATEPGLIASTSSADPQAVIANRRHAFDHRTPLELTDLLKAHASHTPERGAYSVCMHRDDARTMSLTHVTVSDDEVVFRYSPDAPCRQAPFQSVVLARTSSPLG